MVYMWTKFYLSLSIFDKASKIQTLYKFLHGTTTVEDILAEHCK